MRWVAMERRQTAVEAERASSVRRSMRFQMLFNALEGAHGDAHGSLDNKTLCNYTLVASPWSSTASLAHSGSMSPFGGGESTEGRSVLQKTECMISGRPLDQSAPFYHTYPRAAAQLLSAARYGHREGVRSSASRR